MVDQTDARVHNKKHQKTTTTKESTEEEVTVIESKSADELNIEKMNNQVVVNLISPPPKTGTSKNYMDQTIVIIPNINDYIKDPFATTTATGNNSQTTLNEDANPSDNSTNNNGGGGDNAAKNRASDMDGKGGKRNGGNGGGGGGGDGDDDKGGSGGGDGDGDEDEDNNDRNVSPEDVFLKSVEKNFVEYATAMESEVNDLRLQVQSKNKGGPGGSGGPGFVHQKDNETDEWKKKFTVLEGQLNEKEMEIIKDATEFETFQATADELIGKIPPSSKMHGILKYLADYAIDTNTVITKLVTIFAAEVEAKDNLQQRVDGLQRTVDSQAIVMKGFRTTIEVDAKEKETLQTTIDETSNKSRKPKS